MTHHLISEILQDNLVDDVEDLDLESLPLAMNFVTVNPDWLHPVEPEINLADAEELNF